MASAMHIGRAARAPAAANSKAIRLISSVVKVLGSDIVRAGWILKEGGFPCGSTGGQRLLKLTSLVTFLFSDKKVTLSCYDKRSFICSPHQCETENRVE